MTNPAKQLIYSLRSVPTVAVVVGLAAPWATAQDWGVEVVDEGGVGQWTSVAVDAGGFPHISYQDYGTNALKYAYKDVTGWHVETVETGNYNGCARETSIALDQAGHPHIVYYGGSTSPSYGIMKYARWNGSSWETEVVDPDEWVVGVGTLALAQDGIPHASYRVMNAGGYYKLRYAYRDASGWHTELADMNAEVVERSTLRLGPDGYPRIGYIEFSWDPMQGEDNYLNFNYRDASGWHWERVDGSGLVVPGPLSMALDAAGYGHICYSVSQEGTKYAYQTASGWQFEPLPDGGENNSIEIDADGWPHLSYYVTSPGQDLKYAYRDVLGWHWETVENVWWDTGQYNCLSLDANGAPHISLFDATYGDLRYASRAILNPPTSVIDSIIPNPAYQAVDDVYFWGSAWDNDEGGASIISYEWRSDIDGLLGQTEDILVPASTLTAGTHTISLRVYDDEGDWADDYATLDVLTADPPPAPVTDLQVFDTPEDQGGSISLTWVRSADDGAGANDVVGYAVLRAQAGDTAYAQIDSLPAGTEAHDDTSATDLVLHSYVVRTVDATGNVTDSEAASAVPYDNVPPAPPTGLAAACDGEYGWAVLTWELSVDDTLGGVDDVAFYIVRRSTISGSGYTTIDSVASDTNVHIDQTTVMGSHYFYVLVASDGQNTSVNSNEADAYIVGVSDQPGTAPAKVALIRWGPNPVREELSVTYGLPSPATVRLTLSNLRGQGVAVLGEGEREAGYHTVSWSLDSGDWEPGAYILVLDAGTRRVSSRVIFAR
jgi:hypothetical protein